MIKQQIRDMYFAVARVATLPAHHRHRMFPHPPTHPEGYYLHLGSGRSYIPGMRNIDGNLLAKKEHWLDLRNGLPFPNDSAFFVYCCHTLEHFYPDDALRLLRDMRRVISPRGTVRIAVPCLEYALRIAAGEVPFDFPRPFADSSAQAINYLFCEGQHKYGYSFALLRQFAEQSGFTHVYNYSAEHGTAPRQYGAVTVGDEQTGSLVVELRKEA